MLWELAPQDGADSRIGGLIAGVPAASYSLAIDPALLDVSRRSAFRRHLSMPVRLVDVERALNLPAVDRSGRSPRRGRAASGLPLAPDRSAERAHARRERLADPAGVAKALTERLGDWLPLTEWSVMAVEPDGSLRRLDDRDAEPSFKQAGLDLAEVVLRGGKAAIPRPASSPNAWPWAPSAPRRPRLTVLGWPLVAGGEVAGVLVGIDFGRPASHGVACSRARGGARRAHRAGRFRLDARASGRARRSPLGHRRSDPAVQLPVLQRRAPQGNQARHA